MMVRLILLLSLLFAASCQSQDEEKTFSFASSGEFRPFSFTDENGEMRGYDIEVGREIATRLGLEAKPVKYKFAGIVEGVKSGRFDAAVASHTITPERLEHVAFSIPYYYSGPQIFTRKDIQEISLQDLRNKEIAVSKGSTYAKMAKKYSSNVSVYDSDITALEALNKGRHDLVITDAITGAMAIKRGLNVIAHEKLGESRQGIAVAKDNQKLLQEINQQLKNMTADGTLKEIGLKYFGRDISKATEVIVPGR